MDILARLGELGVIPVIKIENSAAALDLAEALLGGGLPCAEITYRTSAAAESIRRMASAYPNLLVGAGTVLSIQQAEQALDSGARFIVSPGYNPAVVDWCQKKGLAVTPGIATPSEAMLAMGQGLTVLKLFPAEALGGIPYMEAMAPALPGARFVPTGGINAENMTTWLKKPMVHAVAGSWLVTPRMLADSNFEGITWLTTQAVAKVRQVRESMEAG